MDIDEVLEQIHTLLRDPSEPTSTFQALYDDTDLLWQMPSALRSLRALGVDIATLMTDEDEFDVDPTERQGVLLALRVAAIMLRGELTRRVFSGAAGLLFRMGDDLIDTKTAAIEFGKMAASYDMEFNTLLTIELSGENEVFGGPFAPGK
jgi:hypothetical protein